MMTQIADKKTGLKAWTSFLFSLVSSFFPSFLSTLKQFLPDLCYPFFCILFLPSCLLSPLSFTSFSRFPCLFLSFSPAFPYFTYKSLFTILFPFHLSRFILFTSLLFLFLEGPEHMMTQIAGKKTGLKAWNSFLFSLVSFFSFFSFHIEAIFA